MSWQEADVAARHLEDAAVDVPRLIEEQVDGHRGDHVRLAHGGGVGCGCFRLRLVLGGRRRRSRATTTGDALGGTNFARRGRNGRGEASRGARGDAVHGDAVAAEVARDDARQAGDAGLRRAVVRLAGVATEAGDEEKLTMRP